MEFLQILESVVLAYWKDIITLLCAFLFSFLYGVYLLNRNEIKRLKRGKILDAGIIDTYLSINDQIKIRLGFGKQKIQGEIILKKITDLVDLEERYAKLERDLEDYKEEKEELSELVDELKEENKKLNKDLKNKRSESCKYKRYFYAADHARNICLGENKKAKEMYKIYSSLRDNMSIKDLTNFFNKNKVIRTILSK